jgi:uncharacterized cupin superfamily protein
MTTEVKKHPCLVRASERGAELSMSHPLNPRSELHGYRLSVAAGLQRIGVGLIRIPPGKESFVYHSHEGEEEFLYILSGRGIAEIGEEEFEVGPGDFMGFPTPSVGHHMRNPFEEDLVYLCGGENHPSEIAHFPRHDKTLVRSGHRISIFETSSAQSIMGLPKLK